MLVNICNALAYSYMKPWMPVEPEKEDEPPVNTPISPEGGKKGKGGAGAAAVKPKGPTPITISPDAGPDLKKAIEV